MDSCFCSTVVRSTSTVVVVVGVPRTVHTHIRHRWTGRRRRRQGVSMYATTGNKRREVRRKKERKSAAVFECVDVSGGIYS